MSLERFREIFWQAFHRPKLGSKRILHTWQQLEEVNDTLSGPLYAVYEKGECDYVFQKNEVFPGINSADDLMDWFQDLLKTYADGLQEALPPGNEEETKDLQTLDYQLDMKAELCEIAYEISAKRLGTH